MTLLDERLTHRPGDPPSLSEQPPGTAQQELGRALTRRFFALTFGIGWSIAIVMVIFSEQIENLFGEIGYSNPVFIAVVWSPAMAATYLVWRGFGWTGIKSYYRRVALWRAPAVWWLLLLFGIPAIVYTGAVFAGTLTEFDHSPWYSVFGALVLALIVGPVEEIGWRGLGLPLLQKRHSPFVASLILGSLWGLWHAPAFLFEDTDQAAWSFPVFAIGVLALAVIITPMFNAAGGSILIAALFHFQVNNPIWPDAQPWDTVVYALVAGVVVWLNRDSMFTRGAGATEIFIDDAAEGENS